MLEGAKARGVVEGRDNIGALPKTEDLAGVVDGGAGLSGHATGEESRRLVADLFVDETQLIEVWTAPRRRGVMTR